MSKFKPIFITILTLVISSCSLNQKTNDSHFIKPLETKTFKIISIDESGNEIDNQLILETLQQKISQLSVYPSFYSSIDDLTKNASGFEAVIASDNSITLRYLNGKLASTGNHKLTKATATLKVDIESDNYRLFKTVTIHPPKILYITRIKKRIGSINTLDSTEKIIRDVEKIYNNINLSMDRLIFITGEFIVSNHTDDVFDNFEHKLGLFSKNLYQEQGMLFGIFDLKSSYRKEIIPLRLKIFQNAKGARVKYEFDVKYAIKTNGTTSYNQEEIASLVTIIKNISTTKNLDANINQKIVNQKNIVEILDDPILIASQNIESNNDINNVAVKKQNKKKTTHQTEKHSINSKDKKSEKSNAKLTTLKPKQNIKLTELNADENITETTEVISTEPKSNNLKNIEYIEKMLSSMKETRPLK